MTGRTTHGATRGRGTTPEFRSWLAMRQRCYYEKSEKYLRYGGRGIKVCDRWRDSFENFLVDMGARPEGMTLDRIDNDGDYEPGNCRWATPAQQMENRTRESFDSRSHRTHCSHGHEYDEVNTRILSDGSRKCRRCEARHARDARARRKAASS